VHIVLLLLSTISWSGHEVELVVVLRPAALASAQVLRTVTAVRINSGRPGGGGGIDDLAQWSAPTVLSSLTGSPGAVAALFHLNWCMDALSSFDSSNNNSSTLALSFRSHHDSLGTSIHRRDNLFTV